MRIKLWIGLTVLFVLIAAPALAGSGCSGDKAAKEASNVATKGHDCTADTQYCLNKMATKLREKGCRVVRRRGRVYVINKRNPRFKARQG